MRMNLRCISLKHYQMSLNSRESQLLVPLADLLLGEGGYNFNSVSPFTIEA